MNHTKKILLGTILFCISMISIIGTEVYREYQSEMNRVTESSKSLAIALEQYTISSFARIDMLTQETQSYLETINWEKKKITQKELYKKLKEISSKVPEAATLCVTDYKGDEYSNTSAEPKGNEVFVPNLNIGNRSYFVKQKNDPNAGLVISEPVVSRLTGKLIIGFSRRIKTTDGSFQGIILSTINLEHFSKFFEAVNPVKDGAIALWSKDRVLLARYPFVPEQIGNIIPASPEMKDLQNKGFKEGTVRANSTVNGIPMMTTYKMSHEWPFQVTVGIPIKEILSGWLESAIIYLTIAFILIIIAIFSTIRHIKTIELLEHQRLTSFNNAKLSTIGEMAAGIAHEINNPLTIISGRSKQMVKMLEGNNIDLAKLKHMAEVNHRVAHRIEKIISGLKTFARDSEFDPMEEIPLQQIMGQALDFESERFKANGIDLKVDNIPNVKIKSKGAQIGQVLTNLLNNSFDAVDILDEKWVQIQFEENKTDLAIIITDSGKGIPNHIVARMMEPFFTTKSQEKGVGLGLSIAYGIIKSHHGQLTYNEQSQHTQFILTLPISVSS